MVEYFTKLCSRILNLIYPEAISCNGCGKDLDMGVTHRYDLCHSCLQQIEWIKGRTCRTCGGPIQNASPYETCYSCMKKVSYLSHCEACFLYEGLGKQLIMDFKYNRKTYLGKMFGNMLGDLAKTAFSESIDMIVSVPLHEKRYAERGFNQMDLIGEPLAEVYDVPYRNYVLVRNMNTPKLKNLNRKERMNIMRDAFNVKPEEVLGKRILIIDDIYTTGATMNACAEVLLEAGALNVYGLVLSVNFRD